MTIQQAHGGFGHMSDAATRPLQQYVTPLQKGQFSNVILAQ